MGPRGLPRQVRIRSKADFLTVRRLGAFAPRPLLGIGAYNRGGEDTRLGLAVSRKVGGAVVRNRIKRRLREAFRLQRAMLAPGWDIVVVPRAGAAGATYEQLEAELIAAARRAGIVPDAKEAKHH